MLLVFKHFRASFASLLVSLSNASMHSVGTKMGTVLSASHFARAQSTRSPFWEIPREWHLQNHQNLLPPKSAASKSGNYRDPG